MADLSRNQIASTVYFVVGRGTEGGASSSYKLSHAGVASSGYSLGAMQLDLGQRGTMAVGSVIGTAKAGEISYVDAVIDNARQYANDNGMPFPSDTRALRSELLTKGGGAKSTNDSDAKAAINAWAGSEGGQGWIHQNVDLPIVNEISNKLSMDMSKFGSDWTESQKSEALFELAKAYNQSPKTYANMIGKTASNMAFENFEDDVVKQAQKDNPALALNKAGDIGLAYDQAQNNPVFSDVLNSAQQKILSPNFNPKQFSIDPDLQLTARVVSAKSVDVTENELKIFEANGRQRIYTYHADTGEIDLSIKNSKGQTIAGVCYSAEAFKSHGAVGDAIDADLPDGTRVVSTSTTANGQTTVTAQLLDKDGHVLLSTGPGQTMERDPETGIVQVRTDTSDQVQQYDPATGEVSNALRTGSNAAQVYENLLDVFSNPQVPTDKGTQIADASGTLPDTYTSTNTNSFTNYLSSHDDQLTPAQQDALAAQINKLGLGNDKVLSFYTLPGGGALIATADGDIVGEIVHSSSGDLNLKASAIDASGETVKVRQYINEQRQSLSTKNSQAEPHKDTSITVSTFTIFCLVSSLQLGDDLVKRAMQVLRRCLFCGVFLMPPAIWAQNNAHQEQVQPLLFNALKEQRFSAAYKKVFEPYLGLKWVYFGSGPTSPAEKKTLKSGEVIYIYSTCRPHACDAEYLYFVYAPSSGAGWGGVSIQSDIESISSTSTELTSILSNLLGPKK